MTRFLAILLAAAATACAARSPVRADIHQRGWLQVETAHIALRTDLERADAIAHAIKLDQYWQALAHLYGLVAPGAPPPPGKLSVVHLASCKDFDQIASDATGFVFTSVTGQDLAVTCQQHDSSTLVHELAHIFNRHLFVRLPVWVEEGLATYYSTLEVAGGRAVLGNFPSGLSALWNQPRYLPSLGKLVGMKREEFYQPMSKGRNYFSAWKLVHLLNNTSADRRLRFRRYLAALRSGVGNPEAWRGAFGDASSDELASDYVNYQERERVNRLTTSFAWSRPPPPVIRRLRPAEAHLLWAELLTVSDPALVSAQLQRAAGLQPDRSRFLHLRVWAGVASALPRGYDGLRGPPPPRLAAMQRDVRELVERSSDPHVLNTIAWYFAMSRKPAAGLNFAIRSVQAAPACARCWDTVGLLYFQAGKLDRALEAQGRAVLLYGERAPREVVERLGRYRAALRRRPPAASAR